jgi:beta-lactamase class A
MAGPELTLNPSERTMSHPALFPTLHLLAAAAFAALAGPAGARSADADAPAAMHSAIAAPADQPQWLLDGNANTDDHSVNVPTAWWTYTNVSGNQISTLLADHSARLTDIEFYGLNGSSPRFSVRMVANSGAYAVPGWWWYYGQTLADVQTHLSANNARLIELEPYDAGGGVIRYAAVMVANSGATARAWSWLVGVSSAQISTHLSNTGHRLIDLDSYDEAGVTKYSAVMVDNAGSDAKSWQWWLNQSPSSISSKLQAFSGRLVKLDRRPNGRYNVVMVKNTGSDHSAWWYQYGFKSMADLNNYSTQVASRPVDITTYVDGNGARRYDAVFIDNANDSTRRMRAEFGQTFLDANGNPTRGIFEAWLKQVGGEVKVNLNAARRAETASAFKSVHLLHAMKQVEAGVDTLPSAFSFYEYDPVAGKDACPDPAKEVAANLRTQYDFEKGLDEMMRISDNRTTRGTVLRYGGFAPFNATAGAAGLSGTTLRHNIGCGYYSPASGKYAPSSLRNDTTAADLAAIYEGVWTGSLLSETHSARSEFLESANPSQGAGDTLQAIINEEAAAQGKSAIAAQFGSLIKFYGKGGSYGTCLPDANGDCGQKVIVRSGAGLIRLPFKARGVVAYRNYVFGRLISDTPVTCWEDYDTPQTECPSDTQYTSAYGQAANELYRDEIRAALGTW